jgi:hypothetical protein
MYRKYIIYKPYLAYHNYKYIQKRKQRKHIKKFTADQSTWMDAMNVNIERNPLRNTKTSQAVISSNSDGLENVQRLDGDAVPSSLRYGAYR